MKSEPSVYSIDDLSKDKTTCWEGVRNYQARNYLRDQAKKGDRVLFYHSNANPPGVAGIAEIVKAGYPDASAWDRNSDHYDSSSSPEKPVWFQVDLKFIEKFRHFVDLDSLKANTLLKNMKVVQRGSRLSVQPVDPDHFEAVCRMGRS